VKQVITEGGHGPVAGLAAGNLKIGSIEEVGQAASEVMDMRVLDNHFHVVVDEFVAQGVSKNNQAQQHQHDCTEKLSMGVCQGVGTSFAWSLRRKPAGGNRREQLQNTRCETSFKCLILDRKWLAAHSGSM
jgi:hypothetical protein